MVLDIALVGSGGMMPLPNRWLSSVLVRHHGRLILFDCGEGTQISLRALGWGIKDIDLVLISHVHGDHVTGLPGLLLTQANSGRTEPLDLIGPPGVRAVLGGLLLVAPHLPFEVRCREWRGGETFELDGLQVRCAAADHQVACLSFRLDVPRGRRFLPERARALGVPLSAWSRLQHGHAVGDVQPDAVLGPPRAGLSLGLVTDTRPTPALTELARRVDLLIAEGMYGSDDDRQRAVERKHMTFREAAQLARDADAQRLVLTHFSPSVTEPEVYVDNAREVFPETLVGRDHLVVSLRFDADDERAGERRQPPAAV